MKKSLLHVGCGGDSMPKWAKEYQETRLDIDPDTKPDIVANMTKLGDIGQYDAVYCNHSLEHLFPHEIEIALKEFIRVLNPNGFALVIVPDLEDVRPTEEIILKAPIGDITGLDMIYGYRKALKEHPYMAHKTGFVENTLNNAFISAGFSKVITKRLENYNLMCVGVK